MNKLQYSRRNFLTGATAAVAATALPRSLTAQGSNAASASKTISGSLSVDASTPGRTLPLNFTGLSYESAQLANPSFFSAENHSLIKLVRDLTLQGVLRLGGGSSEYTIYSETPSAGPPPFEIFGPDTSKTAKKGTVTSALALRNLRAFLDATGWTCLYGLNLAQGTKANAIAEAEATHRFLGPRLLALQIGNEPDSFRNHFRPATYGPADFIREWLDFHDAIFARVPDAKFAGPDISNKLSFLTAFAQEARNHPDVILLTGHYYAMGPAGNPAATLDNLLSPNPKLTTLKWHDLPVINAATQTAHRPFRVSEMNSCWNGGEPGVSDAFASALWCADAMLRFATLGFCGVNLHGGGDGIYSPIIGSPSRGFTPRPEYYGMMLAQHFAGATLLNASLQCDSDRITAYAARHPNSNTGLDLLAVINKTASPVALTLHNALTGQRLHHVSQITAPSLESRDVSILKTRSSNFIHHNRLSVPPHAALLFTD
jgi:hypothetical protein